MKKLYITGDTHGDFGRFLVRNFPEQKQMERTDYVIICGDFGGVWDGSDREKHLVDQLASRSFTTLFVDGNHENFDRLNALPVEQWKGGKIHRVRPNVIHLMRGQVFQFDEYKVFTMGGAASHDIWDGILDPDSPTFERDYWRKRREGQVFRVKDRSWWAEEMPSEEERAEAITNLERVGWKVDFVLSHCAPTNCQNKFGSGYDSDELTDFLQEISEKCSFTHWFHGHYHLDTDYDNFSCLYHRKVLI